MFNDKNIINTRETKFGVFFQYFIKFILNLLMIIKKTGSWKILAGFLVNKPIFCYTSISSPASKSLSAITAIPGSEIGGELKPRRMKANA